MSFLFPNFLYFLFALSIPVIIHLFNLRRYRRIEFTNVSLLKEIQVSTRSVKKIKNLLILLSRLLALTFLILAFAQPFIPIQEDENTSVKPVVIYFDNSISMNEGSTGYTLMDACRMSASDLIRDFGNSRVFYFVTNDFSQAELNDLSAEEVLSELEDVQVSYMSRTFKDIYNRIQAIKDQSGSDDVDCYVFSDFQISQFSDFNTGRDSSVLFHFVHLQPDVTGNVSVDSVWLNNPLITADGIDSISVRISNYSEDVLKDQPIRLYVNEKLVSLSSVSLEAWSSTNISMSFPEKYFGFFKNRIETPDDGLFEDDNLYFSFRTDSSVIIYQLGDEKPNDFFKAVYSSPFVFYHNNEKNADLNLLNRSDLFILSGESSLPAGLLNEIKEKVSEGSNLIIYPTTTEDLEYMNLILETFKLENLMNFDTSGKVISGVNKLSAVLNNTLENIPENANFPKANGTYRVKEKMNLPKEDILSFESGEPALRRYPFGEGSVFVFTFSLSPEMSDFCRNSLFIPTAINMAYSARKTGSLYHFQNSAVQIPLRQKIDEDENILHITGKDVDVIPELKRMDGGLYLQLHRQFDKAGNYDVVNRGEIIDVLSLNYNRKESDIRRHSEESLSEQLNRASINRSAVITQKASGESFSETWTNKAVILWKYCIILALMFFVAEILIIRFVKN